MAANNSIEAICKFLGADSLGYLSLEGMIRATGLPANEFCTACYTGIYPSPVESEHDKLAMEQHRSRYRRSVAELVTDDPQKKLL